MFDGMNTQETNINSLKTDVKNLENAKQISIKANEQVFEIKFYLK